MKKKKPQDLNTRIPYNPYKNKLPQLKHIYIYIHKKLYKFAQIV